MPGIHNIVHPRRRHEENPILLPIPGIPSREYKLFKDGEFPFSLPDLRIQARELGHVLLALFVELAHELLPRRRRSCSLSAPRVLDCLARTSA
jgi:hypothetical protein